ncbi:MAG: aminodeoxychorismate synthase, component I, partial [Luteimonas sp.]
MLITQPLSADTDLLALQRAAPARHPLLLQSVAHGTAHARWDLLLATDGTRLQLDADGVTRDASGAVVDAPFLDALDAAWAGLRMPREEPRWPFRGGWALYLGYELAAQVEPVLELPRAAGGLPVAVAWRCPAAVLRDHATGECIAVAEAGADALLAE